MNQKRSEDRLGADLTSAYRVQGFFSPTLHATVQAQSILRLAVSIAAVHAACMKISQKHWIETHARESPGLREHMQRSSAIKWQMR